MNNLEILVVDDSRFALMQTEKYLENLKECQLTLIDGSTKALSWCEEHTPDLVMVDYQMPELDGLGFIERFREIKGNEDTPLMMITAANDERTCVKALQIGANDFVCKPIRKIEFLARVSNLLAIRKKHKSTSNIIQRLNGEVDATAQIVSEREVEIVNRLALAAEHRDNETGMHLLRMAYYSLMIARNLGLPIDEQQMIFHAAPLHDVGTLGIADEILLKPGKLTADEYEIMKTHTTIGGKILDNSASRLIRTARQIALSHHERFDGAGYPNGLSGVAIPLVSRVTAVADVFDALTSVRHYEPAWSFDRAIAHLQEQSGGAFDPRCVSAFLVDLEAIEGIHNNREDMSFFMKGEMQ